jgi:hypothetical protein
MTATTNFSLPLLYSSQSQKEVTVNQALLQIDRVMQMAVVSRTLALAPTSPSDGAKYVVGTGATGVWAGQDNRIAIYTTNGSTWSFLAPQEGWTCFSIADHALYEFNGSSWAVLGYTAATSGLVDFASLTPTAGNLIVGNGAHWVTETPVQAIGQVAMQMALIFG